MLHFLENLTINITNLLHIYIERRVFLIKQPTNLTKGSIPKALIAFIIPIILGSFIQQLYVTTDAIIVGQFTGKIGLASIDSVFILFKFPINFMNGLTAGATILISRYYGARNKKNLNSSIRTANTLAIILGLICSVGGVLLAPSLMNIMSVPENLYQQTLSYCKIYFGGLWTMIIYGMNAGILRAFGDSKRPLYALIFTSIINILGDILLVGVFSMGVIGAGIATVISQGFSALLVLYMLAKFKPLPDFQARITPMFSKQHMSGMIRIGIPLALQSTLFPIANSIVQASVNKMGTDSIAAWGICEKLNLIIWLIADSMSPVLTTYVAQNLGAGNKHRIKRGVLLGVTMSCIAVVFMSITLYFGSGTIGSLFLSTSDRASITPLLMEYMSMMAPFFIFYAVAVAFSGACCGLGDTLKPMITTLITVCLLRVICIFFLLPHFYTMKTIVKIYIASWLSSGAAFTLMYTIKQRNLLEPKL